MNRRGFLSGAAAFAGATVLPRVGTLLCERAAAARGAGIGRASRSISSPPSARRRFPASAAPSCRCGRSPKNPGCRSCGSSSASAWRSPYREPPAARGRAFVRALARACASRTTRTACPTSRSSRSGRARTIPTASCRPTPAASSSIRIATRWSSSAAASPACSSSRATRRSPTTPTKCIVLRDWRVDKESGSFLPFFTAEGAGKAGTFGTVRSTNGEDNPEIVLPAGGDCRLRLFNLDNTRIMEIGVEDAEAAIVAVDGIALPPCRSNPGGSGRRCASTSWCARLATARRRGWWTISRRSRCRWRA